jgi:phage FluMu gp28-like protein
MQYAGALRQGLAFVSPLASPFYYESASTFMRNMHLHADWQQLFAQTFLCVATTLSEVLAEQKHRNSAGTYLLRFVFVVANGYYFLC